MPGLFQGGKAQKQAQQKGYGAVSFWGLRRFKWRFAGLAWFLLGAGTFPVCLLLSFRWHFMAGQPAEWSELFGILGITTGVWWAIWAGAWLLLTHPLERCIRAVQKQGRVQRLLQDWAAASPYFQKRSLWLGRQFLFIRSLSPFFLEYDAIRELSYPAFPEGYDQWLWENTSLMRRGPLWERMKPPPSLSVRDPSVSPRRIFAPMLVLWLKDGRKITLGIGWWPNGESYARDRALLRDYILWRMRLCG